MSNSDCDQHFVWVAITEGEPGAHASCVNEARWRVEWAAEEMECGSTLRLVSCNKANEMLLEYVNWRDSEARKDEHHAMYGDR